MLDDLDQAVTSRVQGALEAHGGDELSGVAILLAHPDPSWPPAVHSRAIALTCVAVTHATRAADRRELDAQLRARYLLTCWARGDDAEATAARSHALFGATWRALVEGMVRAGERSAEQSLRLETADVDATLWTALGVAPRPALWLAVEGAIRLGLPSAPPVSQRAVTIGPRDGAPRDGRDRTR